MLIYFLHTHLMSTFEDASIGFSQKPIDKEKTSQTKNLFSPFFAQKVFKTNKLRVLVFLAIALVFGAIVFSTSFFQRSKATLLNLALGSDQAGQVVCPDGTLVITEQSATTLKVSCLWSDPSPSPSPVSTPGNSSFQPFGEVTISASDIAFELDGAGRDVDTIAFWEAPDPTQSLMFVTSKAVRLVEVWRYPYQQTDALADITDSCLDANTNAVIVDQETDELYVGMRNTGKVCVFNLPSLTVARTIQTSATSMEPNFALLKKPDGKKWLYVSNDRNIFVHDAVTGEKVSGFTNPFDAPHQSVETAFADNYYQSVYVPTEDGSDGVNILSPEGLQQGVIGTDALFDLDEEGIWLYTCPATGLGDDGTGLIMVSDQFTPTEIEVFDRVSKNHLGTFIVEGVSNTDGIALTQQSSPLYPQGLFAAINNDGTTVGVSLDLLLQKLNLGCGT